MSSNPARGFCFVVVLIVALARSASGQDVRGAVRDSASRRPIPGVVLTLLDSSGAVLGRMLTGENGQFHIPTARAIGRIRAQRLGFRLRELRLPPSDTGAVRMDVLMTSLPTLLEPVRVVARPQCPKRSDYVAAMALLQQARAGFLTTIVAREANPGRVVLLGFERRMDGNSDRIMTQRVRIDSVDQSAVSFKAVRAASEFVERGFMDDRPSGQVYFGPDAEVLLDDGFADGYCFRIMARESTRPNQVGLGFVPAQRRRGRIDIDGALWIDTSARALRSIDFRYLGLGAGPDEVRPGGKTTFIELANGVVFIDRWSLRLPKYHADTTSDNMNRRAIRPWFAAHESGGEVARADWPDGTAWRNALGTLRMRVLIHDSIPAVNMPVRLDETDYRAVADSNGEFTITDLLPGPYSLIHEDPHFVEFGITPAAAYKFVASRSFTIHRTLSVKTVEDYIRGGCGDTRRGPSPDFLVLGRVESADGKPIDHAELQFAFTPGFPFGAYTTGPDGIFEVCRGRLDRGMTLIIEGRVGSGRWQHMSRVLSDRVIYLHFRLDETPP